VFISSASRGKLTPCAIDDAILLKIHPPFLVFMLYNVLDGFALVPYVSSSLLESIDSEPVHREEEYVTLCHLNAEIYCDMEGYIYVSYLGVLSIAGTGHENG
jgi:hypothetical protein